MLDQLGIESKFYRGDAKRQLQKEVEISTATISRINRCIQYGTGGYQSVIEKISAQEKKQ